MILGDLIWRITGDTKNFDKAIEGADKKAVSFGKVLKSGLSVIAGTTAALTAVAVVANKFQKAYAEDELAAIRLNAALANSEQIASGATARFNEFAAQLQATTIFGDDATNTQVAYLASLGMTEEQIKKVIGAAADLASATGISLDTAVQQLNATLVGSAGYLGRQNKAVRELTEEELKAGKAIDIVSEQYRGYAKAVGESAAGGNEMLRNSVGDLGEAIGRLIQESGWKELQGFIAKLARNGAQAINAAIDYDKALKLYRNGAINRLPLDQQLEAWKALEAGAQKFLETAKNNSYVQQYGADLSYWNDMIMRASNNIALLQEEQGVLIVNSERLAAATARDAERREEAAKWAEAQRIAQEAWLKAEEERRALIAAEIEEYNALLAKVEDISAVETDRYAKQEEALIDEIFASDVSLDKKAELIAKTREYYNVLREKDAAEEFAENYKAAFEIVNSAMFQLGEALGSGELSWKSFANVGLQAISSLLQALSKEALIKSGLALADYALSKFTDVSALAASIKYAGASALAMAGAGVVSGYAGSFRDGGVIGGNDYRDGLVARVSSGEEVVTFDDRKRIVDYINGANRDIVITMPIYLSGKQVAQEVTRYQMKGLA